MTFWNIIGLLSLGGVWTMFSILIGVGVGKSGFTAPKDARSLRGE